MYHDLRVAAKEKHVNSGPHPGGGAIAWANVLSSETLTTGWQQH